MSTAGAVLVAVAIVLGVIWLTGALLVWRFATVAMRRARDLSREEDWLL